MATTESWVTARRYRNKLLLAGPDFSDDQVSHTLARHNEMMLERGVSVPWLFEQWQRCYRNSSNCVRTSSPSSFAVMNIGQSQTKFARYEINEIAEYFSIDTPPFNSPNDFMGWIITIFRNHLQPRRGRCQTVYLMLSALVGAGNVLAFPNGIFWRLSSDEILIISQALSELSRRSAVQFDNLVLLNDGYFASVICRQAVPGQTLVLRVGTSLCGGLDTINSFGELGWMRPIENKPIHEICSSYRDDESLFRSTLSAGNFYEIVRRNDIDKIAGSVISLIRTVTCSNVVSNVVFVGTAFESLESRADKLFSEEIAQTFPNIIFSQHRSDLFSPSSVQKGIRALHAEPLPYVQQGGLAYV